MGNDSHPHDSEWHEIIAKWLNKSELLIAAAQAQEEQVRGQDDADDEDQARGGGHVRQRYAGRELSLAFWKCNFPTSPHVR